MELVITAASAVLRLLLLLSFGFLGAKVGIITKECSDKIGDVMAYLTLPCTMFVVYLRDFNPEQCRGFFLAFFLGVIAHITTIIFAKFTIKKGSVDWELERISTVMGNCGFIGIPIISLMFGQEGIMYLTGFMAVASITTWTYVYMTMFGSKTDAKTILKKLATPNNLVVFIGLIVYMLQIKFPPFIVDTLNTISGCTTPLGMMVSGSILARANVKELLTKGRNYLVCFYKLIVAPIILIPFVLLSGIDGMVAAVCVVCAATPLANIIPVFANMNDKNPVRASGLLAMTTVGSIITMPLIVYIYQLAVSVFS